MMTLHTHQSPAYRSREAAWQACVFVMAHRGLDRSRPCEARKGFGLLDSQAIGTISTEPKLGQLNPEVEP